MISLRRTLPLLLAASLTLSASAWAGDTRPIVVELYTSQGCSSCPPADALLGRLAQRPGVIAISLPITYWDMLGWKDTLASEANTRRQKAYAAAMGHGGVYTPQIVVDGVMDVVGSRAANVDAAIAQRRGYLEAARLRQRAVVERALAIAHAQSARAADAARVQADGHEGAIAVAMPLAPESPVVPFEPQVPVAVTESPQDLHIDVGATPGASNATVWLFRLRAQVSVQIPAGENEGHTIVYHNVVGDLKAIGVYKGRALSLTVPRASGQPHDGVAVVVQQDGYGHVIGAAYVSRPDYYAAQ